MWATLYAEFSDNDKADDRLADEAISYRYQRRT